MNPVTPLKILLGLLGLIVLAGGATLYAGGGPVMFVAVAAVLGAIAYYIISEWSVTVSVDRE